MYSLAPNVWRLACTHLHIQTYHIPVHSAALNHNCKSGSTSCRQLKLQLLPCSSTPSSCLEQLGQCWHRLGDVGSTSLGRSRSSQRGVVCDGLADIESCRDRAGAQGIGGPGICIHRDLSLEDADIGLVQATSKCTTAQGAQHRHPGVPPLGADPGVLGDGQQPVGNAWALQP